MNVRIAGDIGCGQGHARGTPWVGCRFHVIHCVARAKAGLANTGVFVRERRSESST